MNLVADEFVDEESQLEELEALGAIFVEDEFQILKNTVPRKIRFLIGKYVWFTVCLPSNYPSRKSHVRAWS